MRYERGSEGVSASLPSGSRVAASTQNQALSALLFLYRPDLITYMFMRWRPGAPSKKRSNTGLCRSQKIA